MPRVINDDAYIFFEFTDSRMRKKERDMIINII